MRIAKWDNLKFFLILTVVVGHVAELYMGQSTSLRAVLFYIYIFHMPAFIFLSGLFFKKTVRQNDWTKVFSYFIFYVLVKILLYCVSRLCGNTP